MRVQEPRQAPLRQPLEVPPTRRLGLLGHYQNQTSLAARRRQRGEAQFGMSCPRIQLATHNSLDQTDDVHLIVLCVRLLLS